MGYAAEYETLDSGKPICPEGTYAFVVTKSFTRNKAGEIVLGKKGSGEGVPQVSYIAAPLRDPANAKSIEREYSVFNSLSIPFKTEGSKQLTQRDIDNLVRYMTYMLGDKMPTWSWSKEDKLACIQAADEIAEDLFANGGDIEGVTFIADVKHNEGKDGKVYVNLTGIRQALRDGESFSELGEVPF